MVEIPEVVKKRFIKNIDKAQNKIKDLKHEAINENEKVLNVLNYIVSNIFGFNNNEELANMPVIGMTGNYIGLKIENEIKYIIEVISPSKNIQNYSLSKTIEYAMHNHVEWFVRTNGTFWDIYRNNCKQPDEYEKVCSINFLELDLNTVENLESLYILCKESHNKEIINDLYSRNIWYGYLNEDRTIIEYMFLVNVSLYEDTSEKFYIPFFDVTYWCDKPAIARRNALNVIEKHLKDEYGKKFDSEHKFETTAYHKESVYIKKDVPVWW